MTSPPLYLMLAAARAELSAETPVRLHTSHAPKLTDADGTATHDVDEGGIGLPFTSAIHRLLALNEKPYAKDYLMRRSLLEVNSWCWSKHPTHNLDNGWGICGVITIRAVRSGWEPDEIALLVAYPEASVRSLLATALVHAAEFRQARGNRQPKTAADIIIERLPRRSAA